MPYTPQTWIDNNASYPLSATRMGVIETGIQTAQAAAEAAQKTGVTSYTTTGKNALTSVATGTLVYDSTLAQFQFYNGSAWVTIEPVADAVATSQTTASTTYAALATAGPVVTLNTGTSALVTVTANITNTGAATNYMGYDISGATTLAAADTRSVALVTTAASTPTQTVSLTHLVTGLTAGANTFTAKYRVTAGTGTFLNRNLIVQGV